MTEQAPARFKGDGIVIFHDVALALRAAKLLLTAGYETRLAVPPPRFEAGCNLGLEIRLAQRAEIERLLQEQGLTGIQVEAL